MFIKLNRFKTLVNRALAAFSPASLFASGEQGVWYDPSDITTLFQDSAGTTPVTAVEQPVGLLLDKSKGLVLGSELVTNGTFNTNLTGWTNNTGATWSAGTVLLSATSANATLSQSFATVIGQNYFVTFDFVAGNTGNSLIRIGTSAGDATNRSIGMGSVGNGKTTFFTATATTTFITLFVNYPSISITGQWDNISVKELAGNHATQSTTTKRPVLSARYNLLTRTEQFDNAAWTKENLLPFGSGSTVNATTAPDGTTTADLITENNVNGTHNASQNVSAAASISYIFSVYFKRTAAVRNGYIQINNNGSGTGGAVAGIFDIDAVTSSTSVLVAGFTNVTSSITSVGSGWFRCSITLNSVASTTSLTMFNGIYNGDRSYLGDNTSGIFIWGAQLIATNSLLSNAYQRVVTGVAGTSTVAGTADYDTVGFPPYLKFDGVDDAMATASINFTATDKMSAWVGLRNINTITATLYELTNSFSSTKGFGASCPSTGGTNTIRAYLNNVTLTSTPITGLPPNTFVANFSYNNNAVGSIASRINAIPFLPISTGTGGGNFVNDILYIGARAGTSAGTFFKGDLYSLIVRGAESTATQITDTETYVNSKTKAY